MLFVELVEEAAVGDRFRERFAAEFREDIPVIERRIGEFDGMLIRSATKLTADLIDKADNLKAVGRAFGFLFIGLGGGSAPKRMWGMTP